jgi:hypothetical protein
MPTSSSKATAIAPAACRRRSPGAGGAVPLPSPASTGLRESSVCGVEGGSAGISLLSLGSPQPAIVAGADGVVDKGRRATCSRRSDASTADRRPSRRCCPPISASRRPRSRSATFRSSACSSSRLRFRTSRRYCGRMWPSSGAGPAGCSKTCSSRSPTGIAGRRYGTEPTRLRHEHRSLAIDDPAPFPPRRWNCQGSTSPRRMA